MTGPDGGRPVPTNLTQQLELAVVELRDLLRGAQGGTQGSGLYSNSSNIPWKCAAAGLCEAFS